MSSRHLLASTYSIDSTYTEAVSWSYDPTAKEYYYSVGCTTVSNGGKIPAAAEFTQTKQVSQKTAMRVIRGALAVEKLMRMPRDSAII